jgi:hypothetical protein
MILKEVCFTLLNSLTIANLLLFIFNGMNYTIYYGIAGVFSSPFIYLLFKHASYKVFYEMYADDFHKKNEIATPKIKFLVEYVPGIIVILLVASYSPFIFKAN